MACDEDPAPVRTTRAGAQVGWARLNDWDGLPVFEASRPRLFTSHERAAAQPFSGVDPGNKDFNSFLAVCGDRPVLFHQQVDGSVPCTEGQAASLIAADDGPGYVSRMSLAVGYISTLNPGSTVVVWERDQPGAVQSLQVGLAAGDAAAAFAEITLVLSWDGEEATAIELPLAVLFGARQTLASFETWPMVVRVAADMVTLRTSLPMPFARGARLSLRNEGAATRAVQVRIGGSPGVPARAWGRLHASWSVRSAPAAGERFVIAELTGRGKYVGTMIYMKGTRAPNIPAGSDPISFLEGDEQFEVDGEIGSGIGTEDCFGGGWYFIDVIDKQSDTVSEMGQISVVRWNILSDSLHFSRSFRLSLDYGADIPATAREYAAVGFYYQ